MRHLYVFLFLLLILPVASAEVFEQDTQVSLSHPIRLDGAATSTAVVNITIKDPNNIPLVNFEPMVYDSFSEEHNYSLRAGLTHELGVYPYCVTATDAGLNQTSCFDFEITPSGGKGMLGFYFLAIIFSYGVVYFGIQKEDITISLLGTFALFFVGLWMLSNGLDTTKNYLTDGFAVITLGVAFYISARMAHEYIV